MSFLDDEKNVNNEQPFDSQNNVNDEPSLNREKDLDTQQQLNEDRNIFEDSTSFRSQYKQSPSKESSSKRNTFLSGLIGVVVGAIITYLVLINFTGTETNVSNNEENKTQAANQASYEIITDNQPAIDKALDTVVGITNYQTINSFWGSNDSLTQEAGSGSGVIYKIGNNLAYIITNHHVIDGATALDVTLNNGVKKEATLVGSDVWTDLAVITIEAEDNMKVAEFGDSSTLNIGEQVIAIGNPLGLDFYGSVTQGIVSGLNRAVPVDVNSDGVDDWNADVLQTDAAINPGNSGGALINMKGQLIGINSMKIATQEVEGIGFAIPINEASEVIKDLELYGEVKRPYMGVSLLNVSDVSAYHQANTLKLPREVTSGVILDTVEQGSPAANAGLKRFDVIVELDGQEINDVVDLRKHLYNEKEIDQEMKVKYYRDGKLQETTMVLTTPME